MKFEDEVLGKILFGSPDDPTNANLREPKFVYEKTII
jgi:hypothetical protein